jgi:hypothetical protein
MQAFPIAPSDTRPLWMMLPILLVIVAAFAAVLLSLLGSRSSRFELSSEGLRLRGDWYGRLIPASQLRTTEARRVNFAQEPDLRPRTRTLGTAFPGYRSGWFRLRNGEKALLYMTDQSRAVHVPTTEGYAVMVTPVDPDAFVTAMHSLGRRP